MYNSEKVCAKMVSKIEKICEERGITYNSLAQQAGISNSTLSYLLRGISRPNLHTVLQVCNALDVSLNDLIDETEYDRIFSGRVVGECASDEKGQMILQRYQSLSARKQALLELYLDMIEWYPYFPEEFRLKEL